MEFLSIYFSFLRECVWVIYFKNNLNYLYYLFSVFSFVTTLVFVLIYSLFLKFTRLSSYTFSSNRTQQYLYWRFFFFLWSKAILGPSLEAIHVGFI